MWTFRLTGAKCLLSSLLRRMVYMPATLDALIAAGADVNFAQNTRTLLMIAAKEGHTQSVETLITAGADVNAVTGKNSTALISAAEAENGEKCVQALIWGQSKTLKLLVNSGFNVDPDQCFDYGAMNSPAWSGEHNTGASCLIRKSQKVIILGKRQILNPEWNWTQERQEFFSVIFFFQITQPKFELSVFWSNLYIFSDAAEMEDKLLTYFLILLISHRLTVCLSFTPKCGRPFLRNRSLWQVSGEFLSSDTAVWSIRSSCLNQS